MPLVFLMMGDLAVRFLVGGLVVSTFSTLGQVLAPKTFAGLFGSAPSVALASLALAFAEKGREYVAIEGYGMAIGGIALIVYACACLFIAEKRYSVFLGAVASWALWATVTALGIGLVHALRGS